MQILRKLNRNVSRYAVSYGSLNGNRMFHSSTWSAFAARVPAASQIGFNMTEEQKEFQQLARKFTQDYIIPKVFT